MATPINCWKGRRRPGEVLRSSRREHLMAIHSDNLVNAVMLDTHGYSIGYEGFAHILVLHQVRKSQESQLLSPAT
jgi:hypothetical protein